ncbi:MAG: DUF928 domain-containing protein [Cyanobacteria bacterium J06621_11]
MLRTQFLNAVSIAIAGLLLSSPLALPSFAEGDASNLRQGLPGRRISGGVRMEPPADSCFTDFDQSLVSIMPRNNLGKTSLSHPTFWFSLPETLGQRAVEFQLMDESDELVYSTQLNINDDAGLSEFQLPSTAPALEVDKNYKWVFSLACSNGSQSPVLGLQGWVRRVTMSETLASQIDLASSEDRFFLYGTAGLWQEQVTELLNLRRQNLANNNLQVAWTSLIASTGLTSEISSNIADSMMPINATAPTAQ